MSYWRCISSRGWELRHRSQTLANVWWQPDLNASSKAHWVFFVNGFRINYEGFNTRAAAMRAAEGNVMGWLCSQFRIADLVFAEVRQRTVTHSGKRWYFETINGRSEYCYMTQAEAFSAAEEAVLDVLGESGWINVQAMSINRVERRRARATQTPTKA